MQIQTKEAAHGGNRAAGQNDQRRANYHQPLSVSSEISRFCVIKGCTEPRNGHNGFCSEHSRQYFRARYRANRAAFQAWFSAERERKIRELLAASTPDEQVAIERGRAEGRKLRELAEVL